MRRPSACNACRARRRKCVFPDGASGAPADTCQYCSARGLSCVQAPPPGGYYAHQQAKLAQPGPGFITHGSPRTPGSGVSVQVAHTPLPPMALRLKLVELYFKYIHDQFHSLYHRPTFLEDVAHERVADVILFAIFALSARFSAGDESLGDVDPRARGEHFRAASESLLELRSITPVTIQACILLGAYAAADGDTDVENIFYNLAGRLSLVLDLPSQPVASVLERELNIRTWWTLCMVDVWSSTAVNLPRIMPLESTVPLPMDELPFLSLRHTHTMDDLELGPFASPLMAEMIKLNRILSKVIDFNRRCVHDKLQGPSLDAGVHFLSAELDAWLACLPEAMRDTQENLERFASHGLGRVFAAVYLGYYHYGQLLNYQFLGADHTFPSHTISGYAYRCKDHAARICDLIYRSFATPDCEVLYSTVAHVIVIASTVQIHTLLFSANDAEIGDSKSRLERNFGVLLQLRPYWNSVDSAMNRLQAFHQTCLRSRDKSFVLDRWLLRFLVEFAAHMEFEPRDADPEYQALLSLSGPKQGIAWSYR